MIKIFDNLVVMEICGLSVLDLETDGRCSSQRGNTPKLYIQ
jgi:hypothetical protein